MVPHVDEGHVALFAERVEGCWGQRDDVRPGCRRVVGDAEGSYLSGYADGRGAREGAGAARGGLEVRGLGIWGGEGEVGEGPVGETRGDVFFDGGGGAAEGDVEALGGDAEFPCEAEGGCQGAVEGG